MKPIIEVNHIYKKYQIGEKQSYYSLRDSIASLVKSPFRQKNNLKKNEFWALKDISFKVMPGEVVGIIGRNGAGKSTLLKILSQITPPTKGEITLRGRIASLLDVGTGFHPELTGRENIFLNGAVLGMKRNEINNKFDEIVNFAEISKFLDTPVKHYSSGMYLRLAFAVAAHLEPEILLIDEVLAVGDAQFQKKCLGKMREVSKKGRTVILVSHNMEAIERLCQKCILLKDGSINKSGDCTKVINHYLKSGLFFESKRVWNNKEKRPGDDIVRLYKVEVHNRNNQISSSFDIRKDIGITMKYEVLEDGQTFTHGLNLFNEQGINILNSHDVISSLSKYPRKKGFYSATVWIPGNFLSEGLITVGVAVLNQGPFRIHFHEPDAVAFRVIDSIEGDSARGKYTGGFPGIVRPILKWDTRHEGNTKK
jgi:lipopolysaccharide transport system ATP-binding protein